MAKIIGSAPILLVADVVASAEHYRDKLGFNFDRFWGDPPCFCMPQRDGHIVMLSQVGNGTTGTKCFAKRNGEVEQSITKDVREELIRRYPRRR